LALFFSRSGFLKPVLSLIWGYYFVTIETENAKECFVEVRTTEIVLVDPDVAEQKKLQELLCQLYGPLNVRCFVDPLLAVKYSANNHVDALYAVTTMKRLSGFELGRLMRDLQPDIALNFIADSEQERIDAMRMLADSCILRPITAESLRRAAENDW
jgi:two-component SAPR family response regulator